MTTSTLYSLRYSDVRTYIAASLFVVGNILLPQLLHVIPDGGVTWLPIYFFTLVGAFKFGWRAGLLMAVASPVVNSVLFGMPAAAVVPAIIMKSVLLALFAGWAATRFRKATLWLLAAVVLGYQTLGAAGEWIMTGDLYAALQDFRVGIPGMLLQVFGGWSVINWLLKD